MRNSLHSESSCAENGRDLSLVPIPQTPEKGGVERRPAWVEASA